MCGIPDYFFAREKQHSSSLPSMAAMTLPDFFFFMVPILSCTTGGDAGQLTWPERECVTKCWNSCWLMRSREDPSLWTREAT